MSDKRAIVDEPSAGPSYARCKRQPGHRYTRLYLGVQRGPRRVDGELGAIAVIDSVGGGRVAIFAIPNDSDWVRVELLR